MTRFRHHHAIAGACLAAAFLASGTVQAQSWNLYDATPGTGFIPFALGPMSGSRGATLSLSVGNAPAQPFTMDTGSNGILVTPELFTPGPGDTFLGTGTETLTSSGIIYNGNLYRTNVVINNGATKAATARVTVLQVTSTACLPNARSCTPSQNPEGIRYMGIGFNRGVSTVTPTAGSPAIDTNPFINLVSIGPNDRPAIDLQQGYIISNGGVTLGLSSEATGNFAFVKLTPDSSPSPTSQPGPVWNQAPATVSVGGHVGSGTILPDSGIDYAFLTPPTFVGISACATTPPGGSICLPSGVEVLVTLPGQIDPLPAGYSLTAAGSPLAPASVVMNPPSSSTFLNTGRLFYQGFDYLYDPANGFVGYRSESSFAAVTPALALTGMVNLPDGFANSLPTVLFGATTLLAAGTGTISSTISGAGGLTVGSGRMNLTGVNTYAGGTTVNGGSTLAIVADSGLGGSTGGLSLADGTLLALGSFSSSRTVTLGSGGGTFNTNGNNLGITNGIAGSGGLTKTGTGTMTLGGASTYTGGTTVNGGTLQMAAGASLASTGALTIASGTFDLNGNNITIGALSGTAGTLALGSGTLTVNSSGSSTLASVVTGSGGLTILGGGTLSLTGANTFTGTTTISSGRLSVNGTHNSDVVIGPNGILSGTGTLTGLVAHGGTVAPGNSIGTLNVVGSFSQLTGSTFLVEANAQGQADRINVTGVPGTATIAGGSGVAVQPQAGAYAPRTTYTILNATGGVTGAYSSVTSSAPFLQPSLSYDAQNVYLTLQAGGFAAAAQTPTQAAVGAVLDASAPSATGNYATVVGALTSLSTSQGQAVMTSISGQNYAAFSSAGVQSAQMFMSNFTNQAGGGSGSTTRVALAEACEAACESASNGWGAWGGAIGGVGTIGANVPVGGLTYNQGGFAVGIDRKVLPGLLLGITTGYSAGTQWVSGFQGTGRTNTFQAGLYGSFTQGPAYLDGLAGYAYSTNQMQRFIAIPGLAPMTAIGQTGANQFFGQIEAGYRIEIGGTAAAYVTPFARLQGATSTQNAFSETGANALNLNVAAQTTNSLRSVLGAQIGGSMDMGWRDRLAMRLRLGWSHEFADTGRPVTAAFAGAPALNFTTYGASPQRDGVLLGLAANTAVGDRTLIYFRYEGDFSGPDSSHALTAGVRLTW